MPVTPTQPRWISALIWTGAALFAFALIISAVFEPSIRVLHTLQTLIYVAVVVLARRNNAWGLGAGVLMSAFWNYVNLFVANSIPNGARQFLLLLETGHAARPDQLIGLIAGVGHCLLIIGCGAAFLRLKPKGRAWAEFAGGGAIAIGYFLLIVLIAGRQYLPLMRRVFGIGA